MIVINRCEMTINLLRRIIQEEIIKISEGRSNTFMASRMEEEDLLEQDQDGDGDEDFDDVRVARYKASGLSKKSAIDKVKKKPLGKPGKKTK